MPGLGDRSAALQAGVFLVAESAVQSLEDCSADGAGGGGCLAGGNGAKEGPQKLGEINRL